MSILMNISVCAVLMSLLSGCTQVAATNQLTPGMSSVQVRNLMGEPSQTQFIADKIVWKYSLHQPWKGCIPYYLAFNKDTQTLDAWFANEAEFARNQQMMCHNEKARAEGQPEAEFAQKEFSLSLYFHVNNSWHA